MKVAVYDAHDENDGNWDIYIYMEIHYRIQLIMCFAYLTIILIWLSLCRVLKVRLSTRWNVIRLFLMSYHTILSKLRIKRDLWDSRFHSINSSHSKQKYLRISNDLSLDIAIASRLLFRDSIEFSFYCAIKCLESQVSFLVQVCSGFQTMMCGNRLACGGDAVISWMKIWRILVYLSYVVRNLNLVDDWCLKENCTLNDSLNVKV